ncbi:MAG: GNAT family N-acetyltransferase [Woeseiaceae bacterium]|nr:GNAT family N-acetyltransferase [Woeseiaceae bacterium]
MADALAIRPGEARDIARLVDIYNHYVTETHITFDTEPFAVGARTQWFTQFAETGPYRLLVAEADGRVAGYASSTRFKDKPAYRTSVETTIYIDPERRGRGIGSALYSALLEQLAATPGVHRAYGGVALPNPESVALHERLGFVHVASYHEVGYKFDRFWDVHWYEKDVS